MTTNYFITGTDTGVGKTLTAAALTLALQAHYWKPIQSGIADEPSDQKTIQHLTGLSDAHFFSSIYEFKAPLSPDQAAALENTSIDIKKIISQTIKNNTIVEGAGGVYFPLNENTLMLDLIQQLRLPVIIVSRGTVGTMNHTLLTIAILRQREIPIHGVVFSGDINKNSLRSIEHWGNVKTLFHLPYFQQLTPSVFQQWVNENTQLIQEALR